MVNLRRSLALASVGSNVVEATEDLEGGVALNTVLLAEVGLLSAVDLGKLDVLLLQRGGSLLVLGGEGLAVAAPWGEDCWTEGSAAEFHESIGKGGELTLGEDKLVALDEVVEGVLGQLGDVGLALSFGEGGEGGQKASGETLVLHDVGCVW